MKVPASGAAAAPNPAEGEKKTINSELWHACAGPLVSLPPVGSLVVYFPQGHSEQVAASMQKDIDAHIPNYPNLPTKLICLLHNVTLHADAETDEVYAQMTLQPVNTYDEKALLASDFALKSNKPQTEFFCKTLTASDTSTHGGFSVPRRAAEKIFPPLDFSMQPPAQELQAKDLHDNIWTFRHIYRGQPKRHLLTTGWSLFVSGKRLFAGDSVLFIRDEKQQLLLGTRCANKQPTNISSSVLSSDSMHIGILAAAAHAAANHSRFTIFFNPRASPSEFVIPLAKYQKALYSNQISLGMRFRMMFETEDSGTRRYMGTITGISDLDPVRWKNSQWRNLQVGWDESAAGERRNRVSIWEIEPVAAPFFICPPPFFRTKRPRQPGMPDDEASEMENLFKRAMPWLGEEICIKDSQSQNTIMPGLSLVQWMNMQHNPSLANSNMQPDYIRSLTGATDLSRQDNIQFNSPRLPQQTLDQLPKAPQNQFGSVSSQVQNQNQNQTGLIHPQMLVQNQFQQPQQQVQMHQQQNRLPTQFSNQANQQFQLSQHQQLQLLRKLQQQQQSFLSQPTMQLPQLPQIQEQRTTLLDPPQNLSSSNPVPQQRLQQQVLLSDLHGANLIPTGGSSLLATLGGQSGITDDIPSCSTSPSTNSVILPHPKLNTTSNRSNNLMVDKTQILTPETLVVNPNTVKEFPKCQLRSQATYQMDYLDTSSSSTSVCLSQTDGSLQQSLLLASFNQPSICDPRNNVLFRVNIEDSLGIPLTTNPLLADTIDSAKYGNHISSKDAQQELSSSIVSQSFGVPDLAFNSIDSVLDETSFLNKSSWAPAPQFQRMRTYTKVYKRGAVGRSIDITRYSGYDELKRDLARMFSIEGQLEDRQRIGWKLVYVDHEKDVLLVGDDPWEEFVGCVRCIRILSPQEVQQMSLDGCDLGNSILTNQACSSSDGGNGWSRQPDQNSGNPSAGSYDGP